MNVNKLIIDTLKPLIPNDTPTEPNIKQNTYEGTSKTYVTFNYAGDRGVDFADDVPQGEQASLQIHFFCPKDFNYKNLIKQIRSALFKADFSYPKIQELYEKETQINHIIFECEFISESEE